MIKKLFSQIDRLPVTARKKLRLFFLLTGILFSLCGFFLWLIIRRWTFDSWDWLICFLGYPFIIAWFVVYIYTMHRDFHENRYPEDPSSVRQSRRDI